MRQISLGFCDLSRAYVRARNSDYRDEALGLNQTMQEVLDKEYRHEEDRVRKKRMGEMLLRLQEEELNIKVKLNFPEEK